MIYMNIGAEYHQASISNFSAAQSAAIAGYLGNIVEAIKNGYGLYLYGNNGVGKSYVSASLCKYVWENYRVKSYSIKSRELKLAFIKSLPASEGSAEDMLWRANKTRFLALDDLGKEHRPNDSSFSESKFAELISARMAADKTTIITTNLVPKKFSQVYGSSLGDLIGGKFLCVELVDDNKRKTMAQKIKKLFSKKESEHAQDNI